MAFREPNKKELKTIRRGLNYFNSANFLDDHAILIREGKNVKEVFTMSKDVAEFVNHFEKKDLVHTAGIKVGEVGRRLRLSLEGSYWLVKDDRRKIWINEKGEMLFLYGRDIFSSSVLDIGEFGENEVVFVCNKYGDIIGMGKSRFPADKIKKVDPNRVVVENLIDRGEYIRRKRLYDSF